MLYPVALCAASGIIALIREEPWPAAGIAVIAAGCAVLCLVLRGKKKRNDKVMNAILEIRSLRENPSGGGTDTAIASFPADTAEPRKRPRPDPDCPICFGHGLKSGNFTGDLVNCDCMEEDED